MTKIKNKTEDDLKDEEAILDDEEHEKRAAEARKSTEWLCKELRKFDGRVKRIDELFSKL